MVSGVKNKTGLKQNKKKKSHENDIIDGKQLLLKGVFIVRQKVL